MKNFLLTILISIPILLLGQERDKSTDLRDSFVGTYACTGLPWVPWVIHTWPIMYVSVEKSLTDSTILYFNDSTFHVSVGGEGYRHPATFNPADSTYYRDQGYYGHFKKQDTVYMVNIVPTVGGYMIYCPKVITTATGVQLVKEKYQVFPNPFKDDLYVFSLWPQDMKADVKVYSSCGNCCFYKVLQGVTNGCVLNLSELPAGLYIIEINNGREIIYKKVVKE